MSEAILAASKAQASAANRFWGLGPGDGTSQVPIGLDNLKPWFLRVGKMMVYKWAMLTPDSYVPFAFSFGGGSLGYREGNGIESGV